MDERSTSLRANPSVDHVPFPHSGNGVTQLKEEKLIYADFLLGADTVRNNDQCLKNSARGANDGIITHLTSIDDLRVDEKSQIDLVFGKIAKIQVNSFCKPHIHINAKELILTDLDGRSKFSIADQFGQRHV